MKSFEREKELYRFVEQISKEHGQAVEHREGDILALNSDAQLQDFKFVMRSLVKLDKDLGLKKTVITWPRGFLKRVSNYSGPVRRRHLTLVYSAGRTA